MSKYEIGIRKHAENSRVLYWLIISGKSTEADGDTKSIKLKLTRPKWSKVSLNFIDDFYWKIFISLTIIVNVLITINSSPYSTIPNFLALIIVVHLTCFFYWIDFLSAVAHKIVTTSKRNDAQTRQCVYLIIDAISLLPLSVTYVIVDRSPNLEIFWWLRAVTLLRFYRIPRFVAESGTAKKHHWKIIVAVYAFYLLILIDIFACFWITQPHTPYDIVYWNATGLNEFLVSFYFSIVTILNIGFGDITPETYFEMIACSFGMIVGFSITTGVLTGALTTEFANREKKRELYRSEYETIMNALRFGKFDKTVIDKISDNLLTYWQYKKGLTATPAVHILPLSLQKEIYFDINFGFLNRSIIFSSQPRSFLRSVSLMMRNMSYLPGDVIMEPLRVKEAMICIASGVIEILSDENDETALLSFTTGTILGETTLFVSIPVRCMIRASTPVELQILRKVNFSRLALKYPEIYRSMRSEIMSRFEYGERDKNTASLIAIDQDVQELTRRKATKRLMQDLRQQDVSENESTFAHFYKTNILGLYVISENIPRVKTLPINLIKAKPWILRPNTNLTKLWDLFMTVVVMTVSYVYPYLAAFERKVSTETYVLLFIIEAVYIIDLYIQFTTAIERNDHFTYITTIKEIVAYKLRSVTFYFDVLATFQLTVYAEFLMPKDPDYAYILLSLNRILKFCHVLNYFKKLENSMNRNLLWVRTFKYFYYYSVMVVWSGSILYLEACPGENCTVERWFSKVEKKEVEESNPSPCTAWPPIISLYWGSVIVTSTGYGDLAAKAIPDCIAVMVCIMLGVVVVTFCTAQASATLKHFERNRTYFQEEVFAVHRFMTEHDISKDLQKKVQNYFRMQWNYDKGFSMKHHKIIEGMPVQQREIILTELIKKFITVPVFAGTSSNFLRLLAKSCKMRVLPPNEVIMYSGSFGREMYILDNGYCEISVDADHRALIGPLTSFGYLEMILGNPLYINVLTLTHARIISLDYAFYLRAVTKYPTVKAEIEAAIERIYSNSNGNTLDLLGLKPTPSETKSRELVSSVPFLSKEFINVRRFHKNLSTSYWEPFRDLGKFRFLQFLLFPIVVNPHGLFLKIWASLRIFTVLVICVVVPIHFSLPHHTRNLAVVIHVLQGICWLDMYLMFHVAYYDRRGLLMFHPAKTGTWYLKNNFTLDLITTFPFYLVVEGLYPRSVDGPSFFHDALGFIMVLQFYKFFQGCFYLENDILRPLPYLKILKFIPVSVVATNIVTGFLVLLECCLASHDLRPATKPGLLKTEYQESILMFCSEKNDSTKYSKNSSPLRFYLMTYYWVTATMTGCGFGDLAAYNRPTMMTVMIIIVIGLFLYGYMFANLTSSMISVYNSVMKFRRRIKEMSRFMKQMNANDNIQKRLILHYEYNWQRTEGSSPQKTFAYVHAALRENIVATMYEEIIRQVPGFKDVEKSVIRIIGKNLDEIYFLRNETIVKYNDIQEYIYLIYRGKIDVYDENGIFITSMGRGGLFGNVSKKLFSLSSVEVVATRNVDVLRLNSGTFFKTLQIFPNTKPLVDFMTSRTTDYIQPLSKDEESHQGEFSSITIDTLPYEITSMKDFRHGTFYSDVDITLHQSNFYFRNSIYKPTGQNVCTFIIIHDSWLYKLIEVCVLIMASASTALIFFIFAFQDHSLQNLILSYILDFMFMVIIYLQFHFSYFDKYGNYVINKKKIKIRYFRERTRLLIDIAANAPLDVLALAAPEAWQFAALSIIRLNRILRLYYIFKYYDLKFKILMVNKIYLKLSWILISSGLIIHFFACIWYFIACPLNIILQPSWVTAMNLTEKETWQLYLFSSYYIVTVITTTGYGDIQLRSSTEIIVSITFMIISRFGVALLAGSMASVINVRSLNLFLYQERISDLKQNFRHQNISGYQLMKMWNYVTSLWLREAGKQIPKFIDKAPHVMKCEVMNSMFGIHLSQCYIFSQLDSAFLRQLAIYLKRFIYFPGNYIVQQGDIDQTMYFIHKGCVSVLTIHPNLTETIHFKLEEDDHFGMTQGLTMGKEHFFSYRAETEVEILSLTLGHWQHLLKYFPAVAPKIYKRLDSLPAHNEVSPSNLSSILL